jgi:hypothetical protein
MLLLHCFLHCAFLHWPKYSKYVLPEAQRVISTFLGIVQLSLGCQRVLTDNEDFVQPSYICYIQKKVVTKVFRNYITLSYIKFQAYTWLPLVSCTLAKFEKNLKVLRTVWYSCDFLGCCQRRRDKTIWHFISQTVGWTVCAISEYKEHISNTGETVRSDVTTSAIDWHRGGLYDL